MAPVRHGRKRFIPACRHYGLGLIPWSPLGGGLLGGALRKANDGRRSSLGIQQRIEQQRLRMVKNCAATRETNTLMTRVRSIFTVFALAACLSLGANAQHSETLALHYDSETRGPVPIPPSE